jgi:peptide deformylase
MLADAPLPLPILVAPDPALRLAARDVGPADADAVRAMVPRMFAAMYAARGIGLAATQVGSGLRVAVVDVRRDGLSRPFCMINPVVVAASAETAAREEGCLSMPGIRAEVSRPARVLVRYLDATGASCEVEGDGLLAACLQHEIDHLDGVLFVDRLSRLRRQMALKARRQGLAQALASCMEGAMDEADRYREDGADGLDDPLVHAYVEVGRLAARLSVARALAVGMGLAALGMACTTAWFAAREPVVILRAAPARAAADSGGVAAARELAAAAVSRSFEGGWDAALAERMRFTPDGTASLDAWLKEIGEGAGRGACVQALAAPTLTAEKVVSGVRSWSFDVPVRIWRTSGGAASATAGAAVVEVSSGPGLQGGMAVSGIATRRPAGAVPASP